MIVECKIHVVLFSFSFSLFLYGDVVAFSEIIANNLLEKSPRQGIGIEKKWIKLAFY